MKDGMIAEVVGFPGHHGDIIEGYSARPTTAEPKGSVVVLHHAPGLDFWCREVVRRFAEGGYAALAPNLYHRRGPGHWADVAAAARAEGLGKAMPNDQVMGDIAGAVDHLKAQPTSNGKAGVIGFCSGGRQAFLAACDVPSLDAAVDCWGGSIMPQPADPDRPNAPSRGVIHRAPDMSAPLLGIFGNDDSNPDPEQVDAIDAELTRLGKEHEFHRYDGADHGFFASDHPHYQQAQAVDGWLRVFEFYEKHLS
ncbi:dienelactone hydrolase family protein [Aeromicrobium sp. S22]|uniref:dienelactone hydrolase family protein n=1 Tax=Aeromicrobium sp. S22 TaxID=2662029 RepID=UPI00129E2EA6|nr:dienelactone hydrolase family protein [Aeromicrobium sp. S22]MRK00461.1 dienelactone hydrolase family protein [Aeromicrobium sp. S22]